MCFRQARWTCCLFPESWNWLSGSLEGLLSCSLQTALGSPSRTAVWKLRVGVLCVTVQAHLKVPAPVMVAVVAANFCVFSLRSVPGWQIFFHLIAKPSTASILIHPGLKSVYFCTRNKCPYINRVLFFGEKTLNLGHAFISSELPTESLQYCKGLFVLFFFSFTTAVIENILIWSPPSSSPGWWLGRATSDLLVLGTCFQ